MGTDISSISSAAVQTRTSVETADVQVASTQAAPAFDASTFKSGKVEAAGMTFDVQPNGNVMCGGKSVGTCIDGQYSVTVGGQEVKGSLAALLQNKDTRITPSSSEPSARVDSCAPIATGAGTGATSLESGTVHLGLRDYTVRNGTDVYLDDQKVGSCQGQLDATGKVTLTYDVKVDGRVYQGELQKLTGASWDLVGQNGRLSSNTFNATVSAGANGSFRVVDGVVFGANNARVGSMNASGGFDALGHSGNIADITGAVVRVDNPALRPAPRVFDTDGGNGLNLRATLTEPTSHFLNVDGHSNVVDFSTRAYPNPQGTANVVLGGQNNAGTVDLVGGQIIIKAGNPATALGDNRGLELNNRWTLNDPSKNAGLDPKYDAGDPKNAGIRSQLASNAAKSTVVLEGSASDWAKTETGSTATYVNKLTNTSVTLPKGIGAVSFAPSKTLLSLEADLRSKAAAGIASGEALVGAGLVGWPARLNQLAALAQKLTPASPPSGNAGSGAGASTSNPVAVVAVGSGDVKLPKPVKGATFAIGGTGYSVDASGRFIGPTGVQVAMYDFDTGTFTKPDGTAFVSGEDRLFASLYPQVLEAQRAVSAATLDVSDLRAPAGFAASIYANPNMSDGTRLDELNVTLALVAQFNGNAQIVERRSTLSADGNIALDAAIRARASTLAKSMQAGYATYLKAQNDPDPQATWLYNYYMTQPSIGASTPPGWDEADWRRYRLAVATDKEGRGVQ